MTGRARPPRLDASSSTSTTPARLATTPRERLARDGVAGRVGGPGAAETLRCWRRLAAGEAGALGGLEPFPDLDVDEVRESVATTFGWSPRAPVIDPRRTVTGAAVAAAVVRGAATAGARILLATAHPASLLGVHQDLARLAAAAGADVVDEPDTRPFRTDGRRRVLRWLDGVAVVSDGRVLAPTRDVSAGVELLFWLGRPRLVVADGPFARVAVGAGLETVALAGPRDAGLAVAAVRGLPVHVVPLAPSRPPAAYRALRALLATGLASSAPLVTTPSAAP